MSWAGQVDHIGIGVLDEAVQMHIDETEAGEVPQWPNNLGLMCSGCSGSCRRGVLHGDIP